MTILDDPSRLRAADPSGMLGTVLAFPSQLAEAWAQAIARPIPRPAEPLAHVVTIGMGGSAIAADLAGAYLAQELRVPLITIRDARIPPYVGPGSVVIATSYSGETEETLAAAGAAIASGAHVLAITSGGRLADLVPGTVLRVPGGLQPRAALAYLLGATLAVFAQWGLAGSCAADVDEAAAVLGALAAETAPSIPAPRNPAKRLAESLCGRIPAVYAGGATLAPVARRWKTQFNENGKTLATWDVFPELTHNEAVGWGASPDLAGRLAAVILLAGDEDARALRRIRVARTSGLEGAVAGVHEVSGRGAGRLARMLSLVLLGDLTSVYLAYLRGIDPTPVVAIDRIKQGMRDP